MIENSELDGKDVLLLQALQTDSSISNVKLAERVGLSPPSVHGRIKRLQQLGYIEGFAAQLNRDKLGFGMLFFVMISARNHSRPEYEQFRDVITALPEVLECHHITGEFDYLLKVVVRNKKDLQDFLMEKLTTFPGIYHVQTSLSVMEVKTTHRLPI